MELFFKVTNESALVGTVVDARTGDVDVVGPSVLFHLPLTANGTEFVAVDVRDDMGGREEVIVDTVAGGEGAGDVDVIIASDKFEEDFFNPPPPPLVTPPALCNDETELAGERLGAIVVPPPPVPRCA